MNEDFDVYLKHLDETDFSTFVYVRNDHPEEVYKDAFPYDMMVLSSIVELGKGYFSSFIFDCQHVTMQEAMQNETMQEGVTDLW